MKILKLNVYQDWELEESGRGDEWFMLHNIGTYYKENHIFCNKPVNIVHLFLTGGGKKEIYLDDFQLKIFEDALAPYKI